MNKNGGAKKAALGISYPVVGRTKNMVTKKSEMTAPFAMANLAWACLLYTSDAADES